MLGFTNSSLGSFYKSDNEFTGNFETGSATIQKGNESKGFGRIPMTFLSPKVKVIVEQEPSRGADLDDCKSSQMTIE